MCDPITSEFPGSRSKIWLLDGGIASQLVELGFEAIDQDPLWSARLLHTNPEAVIEAHMKFLQAGADIIQTNTYQASVEGYEKYLQLNPAAATGLIKSSVSEMAQIAISNYERGAQRIIRGSIGPYGACQHDGSEYHGNYLDNMSENDLIEWHRPRMRALHDAGITLFSFETIPGTKEADCLVKLLESEFPDCKAWVAFSCKDNLRTNHGELLSCAVQKAVQCPQITHIGINCTMPCYISSLLDSLQPFRSIKPFIAYPNSGETWTSGTGWDGKSKIPDIESFVEMCIAKGCTAIGGCCRLTANQIKAMRHVIDKHNKRTAAD